MISTTEWAERLVKEIDGLTGSDVHERRVAIAASFIDTAVAHALNDFRPAKDELRDILQEIFRQDEVAGRDGFSRYAWCAFGERIWRAIGGKGDPWWKKQSSTR